MIFKNSLKLFLSILFLFISTRISAQSTGNDGGGYSGSFSEQESGSKQRFVFTSFTLIKPTGVYGSAPTNIPGSTVYETYEGKNGGVGARNSWEYAVSWINFKSLQNFNSRFSNGMAIGVYNSIYLRYNRPLDWTALNWVAGDLIPYATIAYEVGPSLSFLNNKIFVNPFLGYGLQSFPVLNSSYYSGNNYITRSVRCTNVMGKYYSCGIKAIVKFNGLFLQAGFDLGHVNYKNIVNSYSDSYTSTTTTSQSSLKMPNSVLTLGVGFGGAK
jgi:hypothetical protein